MEKKNSHGIKPTKMPFVHFHIREQEQEIKIKFKIPLQIVHGYAIYAQRYKKKK